MRIPLPVVPAALAALLLVPLPAQDPAATPRQRLHEAGPAVPLHLYPVRLAGQPSEAVAEALGLVLEQRGMAALELAAAPFAPPAGADWAATVAAFAAHHRDRGKAPPHALYAEVLGDPRSGPTEVRFAVVDGQGTVVLDDRQGPGAAAWRQTVRRDPDPLGCMTLCADRLFALAEWRPAPGPKDGAMARRFAARSGLPTAAERAAMQQRAAALRDHLDTAALVVLPTRWAGGADAASATRLAALLREQGAAQATAAATGPALAVAASPNQQRRLYDLLRALQQAQRQQPVAGADYVLVADCGLDAEHGRGYANVAICDAQGEFVLAEFLNDQSPAFAAKRPKALPALEELLAARLRQGWR